MGIKRVRRWRKYIDNQAGLTLIEILIAISILSISLLTILNIFQYNLDTSTALLKETIGTNLARQGIEMLREKPLSTEAYSADYLNFDGTVYTRNYNITYDSASKTYHVTVTVDWKDAKGQARNKQFSIIRN